MHPILLKIGPVTIYSYGVAIATAFFAVTYLCARRAEKEGFDPQKIVDLGFYIILAAIVGSRLLYVIINIEYFLKNPLHIFKVWEGGLVFFGGLVGAATVAIVFLKKNRLPVWPLADIIAPFLALGQSIGRLGCFFAGCCYGRPTDVPWAITFTNKISLAPLHEHLHPTQLYSSISNLLVFSILLFIYKIKRFPGQVFWSYLFLYSVTRFTIETFRGDERGYLIENLISTSQFIGIIMMAVSIIMYARGLKTVYPIKKRG